MLLIDDLLAAPLRALFFVMRETNAAVQAERASEERRAIAELGDLHRRLDNNEISEADFTVGEERLLNLLDRLRGDGDTDGPGDGPE
jgi:Gas vesicle protein G